MSTQVSISLRLATTEQGSRGILNALLSANWKMARDGEVVFLRKGDKDFLWHAEPEERQQEVLKELDEKAANGETLGVALTWRDSDSGGEVLIRADALELSPTINRRLLGSAVTDVGWYVERLAPAFSGDTIVEWTWTEVAW